MWVTGAKAGSSEVKLGDGYGRNSYPFLRLLTAFKIRKAAPLSKQKYNGRKQDIGRK